MASNHVFTVTGPTAVRAEPARMAETDLLERQHLQEWIKNHPDILGEDLLVVTEEYDRWTTASGDRAADRLDVLALDPAGRLVVAELKRHRAPDAVLVQALNYAAMASRFTVDLLVDAHARFLAGNDDGPVDGVSPHRHALDRLRDWAPDLSDDSLAPPRIVLVAEDFGPVLTNTVMFLSERGVDLRLIRFGLHRLPGDALVLTTSQVLPVPQADDFMVRPHAPETTRRPSTGTSGRRAPIADRLVAAGVLPDGERLAIVVPKVGEDREAIQQWLRAAPGRATVAWRNDPQKPLTWEADGAAWSGISEPASAPGDEGGSAVTVLITGSAGLVGHAVRRRLEADGVPVLPVDRDARSDDGIDQVACDVTDRAAVAALFTEYPVTAVVHCGGVSGPMVSPGDPRTVVEVNVGGTANLLDAARRQRVSRFVYCSSIAAYGRTPPGPVAESVALRPLDVYGATKASGEHLVAAYRAEHGVPGVSLRLSTVFGPRRRTDCLIRSLLLDAAAGRRTRVPVAGDAPQQYVGVDDAAAAVVLALRAPDVGDAYNITGGTLLTVQEVIDVVRGVDPRVRAEPAAADPAGAARWPSRLDIGAAARDLGYRPDGDLAAAVADYRTWLERNPAR